MSAIYRGGKLGDALVEALDVLVTEGKIGGDLAQKVLEAYDQTMMEALEKDTSAKGTIIGKLDLYRYIDNIWTFVLSNAKLRSAVSQSIPKKDENEEDVDGEVKLTVVDAKLLRVARQ